MVGWTSCSRRSSAFFRSSPAMTTAVVVPSPTSSSWVLATSTIIFAAGCSMSISFKIVTPSFVITTSPIVSTSILSMLLGPSAVLTALATAFAAVMFIPWASRPRVRVLPSLRISICCPPSCCDIKITTFSTKIGLRFYINIAKKLLAQQVEELKTVRDFVQALLPDHKRPADLLLLMVIGDHAHRMLLCNLGKVTDKSGPFYHFLGRAVPGQDRVLVEREECLERGAVKRVETHPNLLQEIHRALEEQSTGLLA